MATLVAEGQVVAGLVEVPVCNSPSEKPLAELLREADNEKVKISVEQTAVVTESEKIETEELRAVVVEENGSGAEAPTEDGEPVVGEGTAKELTNANLPSFKEESYFVADLKEFEKKALLEFRQKVEEGIKSNAFVPPKIEEVAKVEEEVKVEDKVAEPEKASEVEVASETKEEVIKEGITEKIEEDIPGELSPEATVETSAASDGSSEKPLEFVDASEAVVGTAETETETVDAKSVELGEATAEKDAVPTAAVEESPVIKEEAPPSGDVVVDTARLPGEEAAVAEETLKTEEVVVIDEDLSLWGVPLLQSKADPRTDVILLKFLRARDFKVSESFAMLKNTILWRKKFGADSILEEDFGSDFEGVAYLHGVDKEGHPVSYNVFGALHDKDLYQKAFGDEAKRERFLRWRVQLLEKSSQLLSFSPGGANAVIQVVDLKNSPWPAKKELRIFINQALALLQDNYPELVVKMVLINVPWYFTALFSIISPFLTQRTKSKFVLVRGGKVHESLLKLISPDQLPVQYGGLSRQDDKDFGDAEAPVNEVAVKASEKQTIEIEVPAAGSTILWDLIVLGWDISYGAEFVPSAEGGYTTIIEKTKKITSTEESVRITFKAMEAGKVVLIIDNTLSRKKKIALYRYLIKQPGLVTDLMS